MNKIIFCLLFFTYSIFSFAATVTSTQTGNWSTGSTWTGGVAPTSSDDVVITGGHSITVTSNQSAAKVTIEGGSSLTVNGGQILSLSGTFYSQSTASGQTNSLIINGTINLSNQFWNAGLHSNFITNFTGSGKIDISSFFLTWSKSGTGTTNIGCRIEASYITIQASTGATNNTNLTDSLFLNSRIEFQSSNTATDINFDLDNSNAYIQHTGQIQYKFGTLGTIVNSSSGGAISVSIPEFLVNNSQVTYNDIYLRSNRTLIASIDAGNQVGDFIIPSGISLTSNGQDISLSGNLTNNGTLSMGTTEKLSFQGANSQVITSSSAITIPNLEIANTSGGVSIASGSSTVSISQLLSFDASGNTAFTTNGKLTLLDGGSGMANLGNLNNHTISGNITCQFKTNTLTNIDYRLMSMPVAGVTIADVQYNASTQTGGFETYGFTGSNTPSSGGFFSTYTYNSSNVGTAFAEGFVGATNSTNSLGHQIASSWYIGPGAGSSGKSSYEFEVTGAPNTGTIVISSANGANMTHSGVGFPDPNKDWVLIGNPYPSTATLTSGNLANVDNGVYQFKSDGGGYVEDKTLPPFQGFYVQMTGGTGSVTFNESNKVTTQKAYQKSGNNLEMVNIYISSEHTNKWSFASLQVKKGATNDYDNGLDAKRIENPAPWPNIALITEDNIASQRYYGAESNGHLIIPVNTMTYKSGKHKLRFEKVSELNGCLVLEDVFENKMIAIDDTKNTYDFYLSDTVKTDRFKLHIYNFAKEINTINSSCYAKNDGIVELDLFDLGSDYFYSLSDATGSAVKTEFGVKGKQTIRDLAPGKYTFEVQSNSIACAASEEYFTILEPSEMKPKFDFKGNSLVFYAGKEIVFENNSTGGIATYNWSFGDQTLDSRTNPTHVYNTPGIYKIDLTAQNGNSDCDVSTSRTINVIDGYLSVSELENDDVKVIQLVNSLNVSTKTSIDNFELVDLSGKIISQGNVESQKNFQIDITELQSGIYILNLNGNEKPFTLKFYKK